MSELMTMRAKSETIPMKISHLKADFLMRSFDEWVNMGFNIIIGHINQWLE